MENQQQYPPGFEEYWYRVLNSCPPDRHEDAKEFVNQFVAHIINNDQLETYDWYTAPIPELAPVFETDDDESIAAEVLMNMTGDSSEDQENIRPDMMFPQRVISLQTDQQHMLGSTTTTLTTTPNQIIFTSPFSNHSMSTLISATACSEPSQMISERSISSQSSSLSYARRRRQRERNRSKYDNPSNDDFNFIWNPSLNTLPTEWMKE